MGRKQGPRKGSLQFWPRKRSEKMLPSVNWTPVISNSTKSLSSGLSNIQPSSQKILGFIGYKAGMASAFVKDNTADSMMKGKRKIVPVTIIECPSMKILSVRFYSKGQVAKEVLNDTFDKELIKIVRMPKNKKNAKEMIEKIEAEKKFDDVQLLVYSEAKRTGIKKVPDVAEIGLSGNLNEKLEFAKANLGKEFSITEVFPKGLVDIRGVTTGKGFQGSVKRFGIRLRFHKSEKGVRRIGSIGAWHPMGVRYTVPLPGQMGFHSRITYNLPILASRKYNSEDSVAKKEIINFGKVKTDYVLIVGSVQGPAKRQLLLTPSFRPTKKQLKKQYEFLEIR
jgi:large subunit ribosomal protein L3